MTVMEWRCAAATCIMATYGCDGFSMPLLFSPVFDQSRQASSCRAGLSVAMAGGGRTPSGPIPWTGPAVLCDLTGTRGLLVVFLRHTTEPGCGGFSDSSPRVRTSLKYAEEQSFPRSERSAWLLNLLLSHSHSQKASGKKLRIGSSSGFRDDFTSRLRALHHAS